VLDVERLRKPMERISGQLLQLCHADHRTEICASTSTG
jgi:hypothetical protein